MERAVEQTTSGDRRQPCQQHAHYSTPQAVIEMFAFVRPSGFPALRPSDNLHALDDFAKYDMLLIKP